MTDTTTGQSETGGHGVDSDKRATRIVSDARISFDQEALNTSMHNTWSKIVFGMEHKRTAYPRRWRVAAVAAAFVAILITGAVLTLNLEKVPMVVISNSAGNSNHVMLPDGSGVWLYYGATIKYPEKFAKYTRNVTLSGEAFFDVVKDETSRFIVSTGLAEVEVFGTRFNVRSDDLTTEVVLESGSVGVNRMEGGEIVRKVILKPGEMASTVKGAPHIAIENVDIQLYTSWKDMYLNLRSLSLSDVVRVLSKIYNVTICINGESLKAETFSGRFDRSHTLEEMFAIINLTTPINYQYVDEVWNITPKY